MSGTDRRVRRTRALLRNALLSLIEEKGYERITVQDVIDRADVGRSTFYAHYRDKDELLLSGFDDLDAAARHAPSPEDAPFLATTLALFEHVERYRHLWPALTRRGGADRIVRILRGDAEELVRAELRARFPEADERDIRYEIAVASAVGALLSGLVWWLDREAVVPIDEVHAQLIRTLAPGVTRTVRASIPA